MVKIKIKRYFLALFLIFIGSILEGYYLAHLYPQKFQLVLSELEKSLAHLKEAPGWLIFLFIFFNNTLKSFLALILGTIFGFLSVLFIVINGILVGVVAFLYVPQKGLINFLIGILPHGIIEIPAAILSSSYGLYLGVRLYKKIKYKKSFSPYFKAIIKKYFKILVPLFLIAALIETFITPLIIKLFNL